MANRPSLAEALFRKNRPFEPYDPNPFRMVTANQLNALRDYIEELENKNAGTERPAADPRGSSEDLSGDTEDGM